MAVVAVIPSRWGSTRFPGKPLVNIQGRPLLAWVVKACQSAKLVKSVIVATDDERILRLAESLGVTGVMTSPELATGTDRVWSAVEARDEDIVLNVQGDEPLMQGQALDQLAQALIDAPSLEMATLGRPLTNEAAMAATTAKIVVDQNDHALYFSRHPIPFSRVKITDPEVRMNGALKHVGVYAFRRSFLRRYCATPPCTIELMEGLEQLRALYLGARIKVVRTDLESWGVDTPDDVQRVAALLR